MAAAMAARGDSSRRTAQGLAIVTDSGSATKEEKMPFLLRAAVVGGAAYHVGKRVQGGRDQDAQQQQQINELQYQQQQAQQQAAPAAPSEEDSMAKLTQLKSLLDQGVLTQAEFDAQKAKILQSM
jgi:membrane protease subunit (stomatin/prohibitin family)